ncbi:MAG: hypothetical protein QOD98_641 [Nocardioidaceae bacterium]|jgi:hypothetical protein|nr:hypothetical protein [Nocardioidaceae bacterium]
MPSSHYANVTATLALVVALGTGGAFAATKIGAHDIAKDAVRAKHIKSDAVRSKEIKDGQVTSADVAAGAIGTNQLGADAVTGAKVNESSLATVPKATAWNGVTVEEFNVALNDPTPVATELMNDSGMIVTAGCHSAATNEVDIHIDTVNAHFPLGLNAQLDHSSSTVEAFVHQINPGSGLTKSAEFGDWTLSVNRADGSALIVRFWSVYSPQRQPNECFIRGTRTNYPAP